MSASAWLFGVGGRVISGGTLFGGTVFGGVSASRLHRRPPLLRIRPLTALRREFPADHDPRTDQEGDTDNRRRGEGGQVLQHGDYLGAVVSRGRRVLAGRWAATGH